MPNASLIEMAFGPDQARGYDDRFQALHALKDGLHLLIHAQLAGLPDDARILVAGAGTGQEVRHLAPLFPSWHFTLVDPAPAMLALAREHAHAKGFADRCTFHQGYLDTAPAQRHDAALSLFVSHFLTLAPERTRFYQDIAQRLEPGGILVSAGLCGDPAEPRFGPELDVWFSLLERAGPVDRQVFRDHFGKLIAAHGPDQVAGILVAAGFPEPTLCFQMGLIRGWVARRA